MGAIGQVMDFCGNHFIKNTETGSVSFSGNDIEGSFGNTYLTGMYLLVENSYVNNGVYKIASATSSKITVEETLIAEDTGELVRLYGLTPSQEFLTIVTEIDSETAKEGVASETIDDYSVSFGKDGGIFSRYASRLSAYRNVFDDRETRCDQWR